MKLKDLKINFLGDSITEGVGTSCTDEMYPNVLKREAELGEVRNYGISATRIARQNPPADPPSRADLDFCMRYTEMDDDADIVVVFGGTNDYGHGNAPFGCDSDRTPDTFCGALHYLMSGLIKKYPESTVVFMTPIHREGENTPDSKGFILTNYVDQIKKTAAYYSIPVLDLFSIGGICPDILEQKSALCPDGLHPNDAGNHLIAQRLKGFLETL